MSSPFHLFLKFTCAAAVLLLLAHPPSSAKAESLVHTLTFTDYKNGSIKDWLQTKGFQFKQDATRRDRIDLDIDGDGLVLNAKRKAFGIFANDSVDVSEFSYIEIDWGVRRHPEGASYEQGVRNEAIMVQVFMGDEKQPSGSVFVPDSPYFIGLFLCSGDDRINHPYVGSYFKKGGRYVCVDRPGIGELVTSRYDLLSAYRRFFDREQNDDPRVSGLAVTLDTEESSGSGEASAFVREIRFYR